MKTLDVHIAAKLFPASGGQPAHLAIKDLRFSTQDGEFVAIAGPSGTGKTTTLNIIAGLDRDFSGSIAVTPDAGNARLAYVFQTPRLLPWRTVLQNVELVLDGSEMARAAAMELLSDVGLADFAHAYPGQISLGMQRRAALARAFVVKPAILLMDEPFVSLDERSAVGLRNLLLKLLRLHPATVLFVTHDTREAVRLADRILVFTPPPAKVLQDIAVTLTEDERNDPQMVDAFRRENALTMLEPLAILPDKSPVNGHGLTTA
jgi:ABC-type nitrate/sulfonate/bicarbonate transport system ATPase subunit